MTRVAGTRCAAPIDWAVLAGYWLGELPAPDEAPLEEHLFGCAHCSGRLETIAAIATGVRAAVRAGVVSLIVSHEFVEAMKKAGLRVREYNVAAGGSVNCTMHADDDVVVARVRAPLAGATRIDAIQQAWIGDVEVAAGRLVDVPFDPAAGEVVYIPVAPARLKSMPAHTARMQLVAVGDAGDTPLGEYTFRHTPQGA